MAATMKDLARYTGLGLATISSYINGGNVREKNRLKIEEAIAELHYEVNEVARGLKKNETHTIGVVIPELNNIFCAEIITEMEDILRSHGYAIMVCDCRTNAELEKQALDFLMKKRVDGLINIPVDAEGKNLQEFRKSGKPIVLIDRKIDGIKSDYVLVDNRKSAKEATELLLSEGHRNIGIICGPRDVFTAEERLRGYKTAFEEAGLPVKESLIFRGNYDIESGVEGMKALLKKNPEMSAVFVTNYELTMGCMIGINELGLKLPEQISVVGYDSLPFARACSPALTIVTQPTVEIAKEAASIMLERLHPSAEASDEPIVCICQGAMVYGKSVSGYDPG